MSSDSVSVWKETHDALAADRLQQVQQSGAVAEILEQVDDPTWRPPL